MRWVASLRWHVLVAATLCLAACAPRAPASAPTRAADAPSARRTFKLPSRTLGETRTINVYTPPGYDTSARRYPILYMPDGGEAEDFPHVADAVDAGIRSGEVEPLILVGIENTERRRDMTGPTTVDADRAIAPHVGGSAAFRAFLRDELMPDIRTRVRGNGRTGIIGESLAALFIMETFFVAPDMFDTYIALSPSLWWNDRGLVREARAWRAATPRLHRTLYLSVAGDDDRGDAIASMAEFLRSDPPEGLVFVFEPRPEEHHKTIYRASEGPALRRLFPAQGAWVATCPSAASAVAISSVTGATCPSPCRATIQCGSL
jgi:predicted alpha/beta superfamily hydrolase